MIRKNHHRPLYREVLSQAVSLAWHNWHLWVLGFFAAILQTGGLYDVILSASRSLTQDVSAILQTPVASSLTSVFNNAPSVRTLSGALWTLGWAQNLTYGLLIVFALFAFSAIAQGGLVYGLYAHSRNKRASLRECLHVGAVHLWPVALLNVLNLGLLWVARFLVLAPYHADRTPSLGWLFIIFFAFVLFLVVLLGATTIHMLTLNGLITRKQTLAEAIVQAYEYAKTSWLIVLEVAGLLFVIGAFLLFAALSLFVVAVIPVFLLMMAAALLDAFALVDFGYGVALALFFVSLGVTGAFSVTFQYAAWQRLYVRIAQKSAWPKIHRLIRWLTSG